MSNILVFGVRNLIIKKVLTDPEDSNPMTWDTEIAIKGLNNASMTLEQEQVEARGDDIVQGVVVVPAIPRLDFGMARFNFEAMSILIGGTFTCTASNDTYEFQGNEQGDYFGAAFEAYTDDNKPFDVSIAKMKASQISVPFADKSFASPTFSATGVPPNGTGTNLLTFTYNKA